MAQNTPQWETVPQRDYSRMTEQEALEILRREYPDANRITDAISRGEYRNLTAVDWLATQDAY